MASLYKGIIFDIDGTAVPLGSIRASQRLRDTIQQKQKTIKLAAASGRSFGYADPVFKDLGITCPSIIMCGSAIIDPVHNTVLWSRAIDHSQIVAVLSVLEKYKADVWIASDPVKKSERLSEQTPTKPVYTVFASEMEPLASRQLSQEISTLPGLAANSTPSWERGLIDVHITHSTATKEQAVHALLAILELQAAEVIGVGDSDNDIPMFRAVGHRVAMSNGSDELKKLADEIAPPMAEDGLAQIIEKYSTH
jgi:HAD superfamily hydrolase (TIGR01484 family)